MKIKSKTNIKMTEIKTPKEFLEDLKELCDRIESHNQEDLIEHLHTYCEYEINEIKYYYKKHFADLPNDDELSARVTSSGITLLNVLHSKGWFISILFLNPANQLETRKPE